MISVNDMATVRKGLHLTLAHPEEVQVKHVKMFKSHFAKCWETNSTI